jgi:ribose-phosphate pyrophosphokinase
MLNTIPLPEDEQNLEKFNSISVAPIFAEAIRRIYDDKPISKLFEN